MNFIRTSRHFRIQLNNIDNQAAEHYIETLAAKRKKESVKRRSKKYIK